MRVVITGGCGFIGTALIKHCVNDLGWSVLNLDKLTYAANPTALNCFSNNANYKFSKIDICDCEGVKTELRNFQPIYIIHLAAESHVDNSIRSSDEFIATNIIGTHSMLQASLWYYNSLEYEQKSLFRYHQVSTDEVFGSIEAGAFDEQSPYNPSSPYSASKAAADHLVRAWHKTYKLPVSISFSANNYGPCQNQEKLIPTIVRSALQNHEIPLYGDGTNVRSWIFVEDHARTISEIVQQGKAGQSYGIPGGIELSNRELAVMICKQLDERRPRKDSSKYESLIKYVSDRPGHDFRYALEAKNLLNSGPISSHLSFHEGIKRTVEWHIHETSMDSKFLP